MTRYAVGDIQGCLAPLQQLLQRVDFQPRSDQLWLVGDLINRGPQSLETLRFLHDLGDCTRIVLGNHDLHYLAVVHGACEVKKHDTFHDLLDAADSSVLTDWLLQQRLLYTDPSGDYTMTHAGIPPQWTLAQAQRYAREVEDVLRGPQAVDFFRHMYGNQPDCWSDNLSGWPRLRLITNYFTRMRFCSDSGQLDLDNKSQHSDNPALKPWFAHPNRRTGEQQLLFGHWAALEGRANTAGVYALDTGCIWGGPLSLMNLENRQIEQCPQS